jgi:hypothetical protein
VSWVAQYTAGPVTHPSSATVSRDHDCRSDRSPTVNTISQKSRTVKDYVDGPRHTFRVVRKRIVIWRSVPANG